MQKRCQVLSIEQEMDRQVRDILRGEKREEKEGCHTTIFDEILKSKLPPQELSQIRLQNEAMSIIGAGIKTTKWAFTVSCYHILANAAFLQWLRQELNAAIPDPANMPSWGDLEHLPFLTACIEEDRFLHPAPPHQTLTRLRKVFGSHTELFNALLVSIKMRHFSTKTG
jgi:cytochrome P450